MTRKNDSLPDWDDGRVICPMDVDGMPWKKERSFLGRLREKSEESSRREEKMSSRQMRMYTAGALKAALLIIGVFSVALVLFILFCTKIWFR